jgi:hypothetical protein
MPRVCTVAVFCVLVLASRAGRADEVAPELEGADLRYQARAELGKLLSAMPPIDQRRLLGTYAAFDEDPSDPAAQIACDDDGDYVVVLSEAMLRLVSHLAHASGPDRASSYASFLARSQLPGRRLLPPPPGYFVFDRGDGGSSPAPTYEARLGETLRFVIARELVRARTGDLVCPNPTATKESQDDVWTAAESTRAAALAASVYPGRQTERDAEATERALDAGGTEGSALLLLQFFEQVESVRGSRFVPSYAKLHPSSSTGIATVSRTARARQRP